MRGNKRARVKISANMSIFVPNCPSAASLSFRCYPLCHNLISYYFSYRGIQKVDIVSGSNVACHAIRLVPRVHSKGILIMVDGKDLFGLKIKYDFFEVSRHGVNIAPVFVILAVLQEGEIDLSETFADLVKAFIVASIATNIDFAVARFYHKGSPKRLIAFAQETIREMAGRQTSD